MASVSFHDLDRAVEEMLRVLVPCQSRDWRVRAGSLDWTCRATAEHVAHDLLAYAGQVSARPATAYLPLDLTVRAGATIPDVLRVVAACGGLLSSAIATAGPEGRGWHWGPTDPAGFAALGMTEVLVHTYDITQGLAEPWHPPGPLCATVLSRLFPDAPAGEPAGVLLWCTGRAALDDRPRRTAWRMRAALE
jgi:hypothetical protein